MTHEELERWEKAVGEIHTCRHPSPYRTREEQAWLDAKLIHYLKTGITIEDLEKRAIITRNREKDKLRAMGFKNVKPNEEIYENDSSIRKP